MLRVKICGLTRLADAQAAIAAGADMLGFNFYPPSPRYLNPRECAVIVKNLRGQLAKSGITTVGVFVNLPPERVRAILDECDLDLAQLSGDESPADVNQVGLERAFKVLRPVGGQTLAQAEGLYPQRARPPACLVDAKVPGQYGGTGQVADWTQARELALQVPILLAGGLNPVNVAAAVQAVRPWGVDVASGVETTPGKKDEPRMRAFVTQARQAAKEQPR